MASTATAPINSLNQLAEAHERGAQRGAQVERGRIFTDVERLIQRVVANTLSSDVRGIDGAGGDPTAAVIGAVDARTAGYRRLLDTLANVTLTPGTRPWIPTLAAPLLAAKQTAQKTELTSSKVTLVGGDQEPTLIGITTNVSMQAGSSGRQTAIEALLREAVLRGLVAEVVARLTTAAGVAVADIAAGVAAVEAGGWEATTIVGPTSTLLAEDVQRLTAIGLDVIGVNTGGATLVIGAGGVQLGYLIEAARQSEPSIGGVATTVYGWLAMNVSAGAAAVIAGTATTTTRRGASR